MDLVDTNHPSRNAVVASVAIGVLFMGLALALGLNPSDADVKYDWLSASGAISSDAYADVRDLADEFEVPIGLRLPTESAKGAAHPRTPGAILLALPLLLIDFDYLFAVATFLTIASGVAILWPVLVIADRHDRRVVAMLAAICAPTFITLMFSGQAGVVAVLTLFAWPLLFRGKGWAGGLMLAVAGALKFFPLILVVPLLLRRRYRAVAVTVAAFVALNLGGLALPGVSLTSAFRALSDASSTWVAMRSNGSLVTTVIRLGVDPMIAQVLAIVALGLFLVMATRLHRERVTHDPLPWITAGLLVIPLSWISYDMVIIPALAALFLARETRPRLVGMAGWALWVIPTLLYFFVPVDLGISSVAVRLMILGAWWLGWLTWADGGSESTWVAVPLQTHARAEPSA